MKKIFFGGIAVIVVLASHDYDESDYIHDQAKFRHALGTAAP